MNPDLAREITLIKRRLDEIERGRLEVPLGLSLTSSQTLSGSVTTVTFSSIPQGYRHLLLICQARTDRAAEVDGVLIRFNGDSTAIYDRQSLTANNATLTGAAARAQTSIQIGAGEAANSRASNFSPTEATIYDYASTATEKWTLSQNANFGDVSADADLFWRSFAGRWRSTAAITSITILPNVGPNFVSGSIFQLYGIK
jgi:hypothetical protein